jgi:superoxide dismutase, Cu-Zn family
MLSSPLRFSAIALLASLAACASPGHHDGGHHDQGHHDMGGHHGRQMAAKAPSPTLGARAEAVIVNARGARIGQAMFREGPRGVVIVLEFSPRSLTPGWHGAHIHQNGDCSDFAAGFQAAGAHMGHTAEGGAHGLLNPNGPEDGDLTNIFVADTDGPFAAELFAHGATLGAAGHGEHNAPLLGPKGAALIIHANADDHATQPIGGAGARVACAALKP